MVLSAIVAAGVLLIVLAGLLLWFLDRQRKRRAKRERNREEREHEERMELFDDEEF